MFCKYCGEKINSSSTFCSHCGKPINNSEQKSNNEIISDEIKKPKKSNFLITIFTIIVFVVVFLAVKGLIQKSITTLISGDSIEKSLIEASNEINKSTPQTIDSVTELTTTTASGKELNYHYKVKDGNSLTQSDLDTSLKGTITNKVCTNSETKNLIDMGAGLIYNYYDEGGRFIGKISVHPADCK